MSEMTRRRFVAGSALAAGMMHAPYVLAQSNFLEPVRIRMGYAPYISAGPYFIAQSKGYFKKLNIDIIPTSHVDGSLSMPTLIAGELDITGATLSAGLFNLMSKGANLRLFFERGREAPGWVRMPSWFRTRCGRKVSAQPTATNSRRVPRSEFPRAAASLIICIPWASIGQG
jgi:hypothetical protein